MVQAMGARLITTGDKIIIHGNTGLKKKAFNCMESGLCLRMFIPVLSSYLDTYSIGGIGSLLNRQMNELIDNCSTLGINISSREGKPPYRLSGLLRPGNYKLNFKESSQFLTGLLFALPLADGNSSIHTGKIISRPYIDMTLDVLTGHKINIIEENDVFHIPGGQSYSPAAHEIEADWSSAAFILVAGALNGDININGLNFNSRQADRMIIDALYRAGADISINGRINLRRPELRAIEFNVNNCPDLLPPLAALACRCKGRSVFTGINRLRTKESDRPAAIRKELIKIGIECELGNDYISITGGTIKGGETESHGDHRIAMMLAVLSLVSEKAIVIHDNHCVNKSWPGFWKIFLENKIK